MAASLAYLHDGATTTEPPHWPPRAFASLPLPTRASSRPLFPCALFILSRDRYDASASIVRSFFRRGLLTMSYNFRLLRYPVRSAQAVEGLACERRQTSGRCAEGSGQAGEEGDWRAGGCRSRAEVTGGRQVIGHHGCGKKFTLQRLHVTLLQL